MSSSSSSTSRSITRAIIALSIISCASPLHHNLNNAVTTETRHPNNVHSNSEQSSSILRRRSTQQSERYYATWNPSQLCGMKSNFDAWEESYESLEECCEMKFAWDYDACIGKWVSNNNKKEMDIRFTAVYGASRLCLVRRLWPSGLICTTNGSWKKRPFIACKVEHKNDMKTR